LTRKPRDVRMGRGKGSPALKVYPLRAGKIIFEFKGVKRDLVLRALKTSTLRLPIQTIIVKKYDKRTDNFKSS
jgi:large subunit ribosomal protein L16